jgi:hypothetical protein
MGGDAMTRDDIIQMAKKAGMAMGFEQGIAVMHHENLVRFANQVAAAKEQEMLAEGWVLDFPPPKEEDDQ